MSSTAILLVPALAAPAFGLGIWLGVRSVTGETSARRRHTRCTPVLRPWPDLPHRPAAWPPARRTR
ncbi:hypothetical protein D7D52_37135 [Nocardia yunnanensis]|uniref:Uncharacterized protein n=1 Tax=Nocardia yunnanensis TaxID=2382165 RepID=A0A386ZMY1_9NOCA|nr:hypothetical protein [Nocardia yunnanensis]AYF78524.1 hypothetical protein D7D52_37135 [Nocardia yunnanensis]